MADSDDDKIFHSLEDGAENSVAIEAMLDDVQDNPNAVADGRSPPQDLADVLGNGMPTEREGRDVADEVARDVAQADTRSLDQQHAFQVQVANEAQEMGYLLAVHEREMGQRDAEGKLLAAMAQEPGMWHSAQQAIAICFERWQQHAVAVQQIKQRAFDFHAWNEDRKVAQLRPVLGTPAGQQRVIDNARAVLPRYGIDADWFYAQWNMSPALRDHRATLFFADALATLGAKVPKTKPKANGKAREDEPFSPADAIAERQANAEWADSNIEEILGAA
jgi:hypothetical protein